MNPAKQLTKSWLFLGSALILSGCVAIPPPPPIPETIVATGTIKAEEKPRVVHTVIPTEKSSCGSLREFVVDVQNLAQQERKVLLDQLSQTEGEQFSCDRLKTGLLLSQIGKTAEEDSSKIPGYGATQRRQPTASSIITLSKSGKKKIALASRKFRSTTCNSKIFEHNHVRKFTGFTTENRSTSET